MHTIETQNQFNTDVQVLYPYIEPSGKVFTKEELFLSPSKQEYPFEDLHESSQLEQEQQQDIEAKIKFLTESWIDDFEKQLFKGRTLNELLNERII